MAVYEFNNIKDRPDILNKNDIIAVTFTGGRQEITLPPGRYRLRLWGAKGGADQGGDGCSGGYAEGILTLYEPTTLYIYIGGQGKGAATNTGGGFNGGGNAGGYGSSGAGGGASDVRLRIDSLYSRVIVAGGGAGSGVTAASINNYGWGGGLEGGPNNAGQKAGQTYGYAFGQGGHRGAANDGGGGGGGWYGGYAATADHSGAGGSGYVFTESTASYYPNCQLQYTDYLEEARTIPGNQMMPMPSADDSDTGSSMQGNRGNGIMYFYVREIGSVNNDRRKNSNYYKDQRPQPIFDFKKLLDYFMGMVKCSLDRVLNFNIQAKFNR